MLFRVRQASEGSERMPDPCIETEELVLDLVERCRHSASAVDHLAEATAVAKETEPYLRIGKCS